MSILLPSVSSDRISPSGLGNFFKTSSIQLAAASIAGVILQRPIFLAIIQDPFISVHSVSFIARGLAAVGESLTIDFLSDGVSLLVAPFVYNSTQLNNTLINVPVNNTKRILPVGSIVTVNRTYVAGGGPTPIGNNKVEITFERNLVSQDESAP